MKLFISHVHEEQGLAASLKGIFETRVQGAEAWASSVDQSPGEEWLDGVKRAMGRADTVLVLCSSRSLRQPWVNFEAGAGWGREIRVVPLCHSDVTVAELPFPLSSMLGFDLFTRNGLSELLEWCGGDSGELDTDWAAVQDALDAIDYVPPARRPLPGPTRPRAILIDGAHGQTEWPLGRKGTLFDWPDAGFSELVEPGSWVARWVERRDQLRAGDLDAWSGMIVALPFRRRMSAGVVDQVVRWVRAGGRLLLLGFELGDLHHGGNLNDLASRFGLRFHGDIVSPHGWAGGKPYGEPVCFGAKADHPVLQGVESVWWRNVQTLALEPGTRPLLTVGANGVSVPTHDSVGFAGGSLTMPNPRFETHTEARWVPVMVEATPHLTGDGGVLACGTWDLLTTDPPEGDQLRLMQNVLDWLAGPEANGAE